MADEMHDHGVEEAKERVAVRRAAELQDREERAYGALAMDSLREDVGEPDFHQGARVLEGYLASLPADERARIEDARMKDGTPYLHDPVTVRGLVKKVIGELPSTREGVEAELATIKGHIANHGQPPYYKGPEADRLQMRYRALLQMRGGG